MVRSSVVLLLVALLLAGRGVPLAAEEEDAEAFRVVAVLLPRHDADEDGVLDPRERENLAAAVAVRWGAEGTKRLDRLLGAADADGDGRVTRAEWGTLGERWGLPAGWVRTLTVLVPMSDGARLATDVWLPAATGPFATILMRTPYGRGVPRPPTPVHEGYVVVRQDVRGRGDSEGENLPFVGCGWGEHRDGAETVAWIRRQPWSDGRVGTHGGSAGGITQNLLAGARPEGLVCQHVKVAAASLYHDAVYVGGAFRKSQVEGWLEANAFDEEVLALYRAHPDYDDFWRAFDSTTKHEVMEVPALHLGGWFDAFAAGTVASYVGRQSSGGEGARGRQVLVMGPWAHGGFRRGGRVGELRFPDARIPPPYMAARWFAHHLRGEDNGTDALAPVAYYAMGDADDPEGPGNEWRYAATWPVPSRPTAYFLHPGGDLLPEPPRPGEEAVHFEYTFDPADPCPTAGGANLVLPSGPMDQEAVEARPDVLVFSTPPLEGPVEVTGHARAVLRVSSSARDTDLSVRLADVYPDGRSLLMAEGMLRLRFRGGFEAPRPLTPGAEETVTVELWPTSVVFGRGHRIRLAITSSNYPRFDVNPGTGRPGHEETDPVRQTNRIFLGGERPSHLLLPVVPAPGEGDAPAAEDETPSPSGD